MTVPQVIDYWRKSSFSQNDGACVELGGSGGVRDSKNPAGPVLGTVSWTGLVALAKAAREH